MASFSDDFEAGGTLAGTGYTDIIDCEIAAGGLGGSSFAVASSDRFGEFSRAISPTGRNFKVSVKLDHSAFEVDYSAIELRPTAGTVFLDVRHVAVGNKLKLNVYTSGLGEEIVSDDNVIVPGTEQTLMICGTFATPNGTTVPDFDGSVRLYLDGVLIGSATNIPIKGAAGGATVVWGKTMIGPQGKADDFSHDDVGCVALTDDGGDLSIPCCEDRGSTAGGGDVGTNPDPVGDLPPWSASCTGGGDVDSVADLADGESWL